MYNFNKYIDFISIFITSIYQIILDKNLNKHDFNNLLKLSNFISNTGYCKKCFYNSRDIKTFFYNAKKYSNLVFSNKFELENYSPYTLFEYIFKNFNSYNFDIQNIDSYDFKIEQGNEHQVYTYILSTSIQERIDSYLNIFNKINNINFYELNGIYLKYFLKNIKEDLYFVNKNMLSFIKFENLNVDNYKNIFVDTLNYISKIEDNINNDDIDIDNVDDDIDTDDINYDENIFLFKDKVLKILDTNKDISNNVRLKYIIEHIFFHKKYTILKKLDNYISNINTLNIISKIIFK